MLFESYGFWLIFGMLLIISEALMMSFVAVFFGLGALVVGTLTWLGLLTTLPWQLLCFAVVSLALLFLTRRRFKSALKGEVAASHSQAQSDLIGQRVEVVKAFENGKGVVFFRGARWDAYSEDALAVNASAWIVDHTSITLTVSNKKP